MVQLHKNFTDSQVKEFIERYIVKKVGRKKVSLPTIIDRAKGNNFYFPRPKRKVHDRTTALLSFKYQLN